MPAHDYSNFQDKIQNTGQSTIEAQFKRIYELTTCRTQAQLAKVLGVSQSSIADAKKRGAIPFSWLTKLTSLFGVHPSWIIYGYEPQFIEQNKLIFEIVKLLPDEVLTTELERRKQESLAFHP